MLSVILALGLLLAACRSAASGEAQTESIVPETTAPAETETEPETEALPETLDVSEIRIGMVFYGTEEESSVLSLSLREGLTEAAREAGMEESQIRWIYMDREADWTEIEDAILSCVEEGCQLIFGAAREYEGVIAAIAEEYPGILFASVESELSNGSNSGTYRIDLAAMQYLCGVAAALSDTSGHIGFLAAKDSDNEAVTAAVNAFAYGVHTVNPDAVVELEITGKWYLPESERQGIRDLQELNCHVVGGLTDCYAGLQLALENGFTIAAYGTDSWVSQEYQEQIAGTAGYRWERYFTYMIGQVIGKEVTGELWAGDYGTGAAGFSTARDWDLSACYELLQSWYPDRVPDEIDAGETERPDETPAADPEETQEETPETENETETEEPGTIRAEDLGITGDGTNEAGETEGETDQAGETEGETDEAGETSGESDEPEETIEESDETDVTGESDESETDAAEELPPIEMDEETGYLTNVRVHQIVVPEEE